MTAYKSLNLNIFQLFCFYLSFSEIKDAKFMLNADQLIVACELLFIDQRVIAIKGMASSKGGKIED